MSIASSAATSADWSSARVISSKNPHKFNFIASFKTNLFSSNLPTSSYSNLRVFNVNSTNFPVVELDIKSQKSPEECPAPSPDADDLNNLLCRLFQNPQTEDYAYAEYEKVRKKAEFRPNKSTLEQLISHLIRSKKWGLFTLVCEDFKNYNVVPDGYTCSRLVTSCIRASVGTKKYGH